MARMTSNWFSPGGDRRLASVPHYSYLPRGINLGVAPGFASRSAADCRYARFANEDIELIFAICYIATVVNAVYSKSARKALRRMPRTQAELILGKIEFLLTEPNALARNVTKLVNEPGYRLRVGDWRVVFDRKGDTVVIWNIAPRGSAYR